MQEKTKKKSLAFLTVEACPSYLGTSGKNTHSSLKHFFALPAMRPGDSQGGGFSAAPLEPASYQCSCRDKNIASGGTSAKTFFKRVNIRILFHFGTMRASSPTRTELVLGMTGGLPRQCEHWLAMTCFYLCSARWIPSGAQWPIEFRPTVHALSAATRRIRKKFTFIRFTPWEKCGTLTSNIVFYGGTP